MNHADDIEFSQKYREDEDKQTLAVRCTFPLKKFTLPNFLSFLDCIRG